MNGTQKAIKIGAICLAAVIIFSIISAIIGILSMFTENKDTLSFNKNYQDINNLEIEAGASNIYIEAGDSFTVVANDIGARTSIDKFGNTLKIREKGSWFWQTKNIGEIRITIPEGLLKSLDIDAGAGKININNLNVDKFDIEQGAGTIEINHITTNKTDIDGGAGEINIADSEIYNLDLDAGVGKVTIDGIVYGNSEIDCGVGEVNLNLNGDESIYTLAIDKGIGSIKINGDSFNNNIYGNGVNRINIDGGVGAININVAN